MMYVTSRLKHRREREREREKERVRESVRGRKKCLFVFSPSQVTNDAATRRQVLITLNSQVTV